MYISHIKIAFVSTRKISQYESYVIYVNIIT